MKIAVHVMLLYASFTFAQVEFTADTYITLDASGWQIKIHPTLFNKERAIADSALVHLVAELLEIETLLPHEAIIRLKAMPIWLEYSSPNKRTIQFHISRGWLLDHGYLPEKVRSIEIVAPEYIEESYREWLPVLPAMMFAYYHRVATDSNALVKGAFANTQRLPVYADAHFKGRSDYFVQASHAYFASNWVSPRDREDLHKVDSLGYEMVRTVWEDDGLVDPPHEDLRYVEADVLGWTIVVDTQLVDTDTSLLKQALGLLGKELNAIKLGVPPWSLIVLQKAKIYLLSYAGEGHWGRYWPVAYKYARNTTQKRMAGNIEIIPGRYIDAVQIEGHWMLLHELAHAYHDRLPALDCETIEKAFKMAEVRGLYRQTRKRLDFSHRGYALTNVYEYFAELSTMYFGRINYFPEDRFDLKGYDPQGYRMIEAVWGVK